MSYASRASPSLRRFGLGLGAAIALLVLLELLYLLFGPWLLARSLASAVGSGELKLGWGGLRTHYPGDFRAGFIELRSPKNGIVARAENVRARFELPALLSGSVSLVGLTWDGLAIDVGPRERAVPAAARTSSSSDAALVLFAAPNELRIHDGRGGLSRVGAGPLCITGDAELVLERARISRGRTTLAVELRLVDTEVEFGQRGPVSLQGELEIALREPPPGDSTGQVRARLSGVTPALSELVDFDRGPAPLGRYAFELDAEAGLSFGAEPHAGRQPRRADSARRSRGRELPRRAGGRARCVRQCRRRQGRLSDFGRVHR
jgi:hypothetical protein